MGVFTVHLDLTWRQMEADTRLSKMKTLRVAATGNTNLSLCR